MTAMKKISAMYKTEKYHQTKPGSIHDAVAQMQMNEQKIVSIKVNEFEKMIETYLSKGGVIDTTSVNEDFDLDEEINALPLNEVRGFIETYNKWFLTNYRAEEFIISDELDEGISLGGKQIKPNQGIPAPKVGKGTGSFTLGGKSVGPMRTKRQKAFETSPTSSVKKPLMPEKVDAGGDRVSSASSMGTASGKVKEPNAFQKFVGKIKKFGVGIKKQMTRDYNPFSKGTSLNK